MEETPLSFDDFSVEMQDFEFRRVKEFDRIWNYGPGGSFAQRPLVHDGVVYVGCMDHFLYALDASNGNLIWKFEARNGIWGSSPVYEDGMIYFGSFDYNVYALDAATGEMRWKFPTREEVMGDVCIANGRLYVGSKDQIVYCIDAKTGKLIWKYNTQGVISSTPVVHEGKLFIGSFDHMLYCLNALNGDLIWRFKTQGEIFNDGPLLIHDGIIYFGSFDNNLRAVDIETGSLVWKFTTGTYGGMGTAAVYHKGMILQTNREGLLWALDLHGKVLWKFKVNYPIANPAVHEDRIYVGSEDKNLYCLGLDGKLLWKFTTQGALWWKPVVWNDTVFFTSLDCFVYAVDIHTRRLAWKFRGHGPPSYTPPPYEAYELQLKIPESVQPEEKKKAYELNLPEDEGEDGKFYKSRITYQVSTQYQSRGGKYQVDSDEEEL